ncbi:MAG TPA: SDR family NAD(P)-dependent oxidoreductase [Opitutus sp.]|nr:SDR family NAD(P)-dependent oxidoreductase [Opitutus sp.]
MRVHANSAFPARSAGFHASKNITATAANGTPTAKLERARPLGNRSKKTSRRLFFGPEDWLSLDTQPSQEFPAGGKGRDLVIAGLACRFPGARNAEAFWDLMLNGRDAITEVPPDRWNIERYYQADPNAPGRMSTRWGGFTEDPAGFDAAFFGISPRDAMCMDPQHRRLLEMAWECLEDAALPPERLRGSRTGVFVGISHCDYEQVVEGLEHIGAYTPMGGALSMAANRISYFFDFRGPSLAVDTACSSSLTALHLATSSLLADDCEFALVGGASLLLSPRPTIGFSHARMLSPRGRCRPFDAGADGYVRAEGTAMILLMRADRAARLGIEARARLVATRASQNGHSSGLTVPDREAQERMMREALQSVGAGRVAYVEAHGTGTPVGDPIESNAIASALATSRGDLLPVGSVKGNIGHLEAASGMAGLIKAVLILEKGIIPPTLHFEKPNPRFPSQRLRVVTRREPLRSFGSEPPLVAVNSFGFGGANAHALLAPAHPEKPGTKPAAAEMRGGHRIFPMSARSSSALQATAEAIAATIAASDSLENLCALAAHGRSHHPCRAAVVAVSPEELREKLLAFARTPGKQEASGRRKTGFVFCGQGAQWWAMGRGLYESEPEVRAFWNECDSLYRKLGGPSLLGALLAEEKDSPLDRTELAQPALFALQGGLVKLWESWGIRPSAVLGHSVGEAAAAWAAGAFDLEEILRIIRQRSVLQETTRGRGGMLAVSGKDPAEWLRRFDGRVSIAAWNAPSQVTLAGDRSSLEQIASECDGVFHRFLRSDYAFHGAQMDPIREALLKSLEGTRGKTTAIPMFSTVTGQAIPGPSLTADYWWRNVRDPVLFGEGIAAMLRSGIEVFVSIGPHPVLASAIAEVAGAQRRPIRRVASQRRDEPARRTMLEALGALYEEGYDPSWERLCSRPRGRQRLPAYPWQHVRAWYSDGALKREIRAAAPHPLLGDRQESARPAWRGTIDPRILPWLADHRIGGSAVLPAAAVLEMGFSALRQAAPHAEGMLLERVRLLEMVAVSAESTPDLSTTLDLDAGRLEVRLAGEKGTVLATGSASTGRITRPKPLDLAWLRKSLTQETAPEEYYRRLQERGQGFGPAFQGVISFRSGNGEVLSEIRALPPEGRNGYVAFPPALDSCFHGCGLLLPESNGASILRSVRRAAFYAAWPERVWSHVRPARGSADAFDVTVCDQAGEVLLTVEGLQVQSLGTSRDRSTLFASEWIPLPPLPGVSAVGPVLVIHQGRDSFAESLLGALGDGAIEAEAVDCRDGVDFWSRPTAQGISTVIYVENPASGAFRLPAVIRGRIRATGPDRQRWLIVTSGAQRLPDDREEIRPFSALAWGCGRTAQSECPEWRVSLLDCDIKSPPEAAIRELFAAEPEPEVVLREGSRFARRFRPMAEPKVERDFAPPGFRVCARHAGRLDALEFRGAAPRRAQAGEVEVRVAAAGLNFRDLMKALDIYPLRPGEEATYGDEFSGTVVSVGEGVAGLAPGDRVAGFAGDGGAFASHVITRAELVWQIPDPLDWQAAASMPVAFGTAFHALRTLARLRSGETVLIHAGAGGVGLAAVRIARSVGAIVFATAGSPRKRDLLRSLGVAQVFDSRTLDFAEEIRRITDGRGVDVVLNSLAGDFQRKSLEICAARGRFVEIGKRDLHGGGSLPLAVFQRSLAFFAFDLGAVLAARGTEARSVRRFLSRGMATGDLRPLPVASFPAAAIEEAFREMQAARHVGKLVVDFSEPPAIQPEFWPDPEGLYLVAGGLGGLGWETTRWLVERGARHVALLGRNPPSKERRDEIGRWSAGGICVEPVAVDIADAAALRKAFDALREKHPPLRGVFHSAMVLRDRRISDLTDEDLATVLAPKVAGSWNLHELTKGLDLHCFVLFSSISGVIGPVGAAAYAAANAFQDALANLRRREGLAALSVNWGQIADVGVAANHPAIARYLSGIGMLPIDFAVALRRLGFLIPANASQAAVIAADWERLGRADPKFRESPIYRDLAGNAAGGTASEWRAQVLAAEPAAGLALVLERLMAEITSTLGMPAGSIPANEPIRGMDSLMAVELRVRIEGQMGIELPVGDLHAGMTPASLAERLLHRLSREPEPSQPASSVPAETLPSAPAAVPPPAFRTEPIPLRQGIAEGKLPPLTAAALMAWPQTLFDQAGKTPEEVLSRIHPEIALDFIIESPLGNVGVFMLPLASSQVRLMDPSMIRHCAEGVRLATECGARCVALTGTIPSATGYGERILAAAGGQPPAAAITTGHATTIAAVVMNLEHLLAEAGRTIERERVLFFGLGSIGEGALRLMLDRLPHPSRVLLRDPYRDRSYFDRLAASLRDRHGYAGEIAVLRDIGEISAATVVIAATNTENQLAADLLAEGTLVVDDSSPHCMPAMEAFRRLGRGELLFTEGGFLAAPAPMPRIVHIPEVMARDYPDIPTLVTSILNPNGITACILSALLSAREESLPPTVGRVSPEESARHWQRLCELGFTAAGLSYEGTELDRAHIEGFRNREIP